MTHSFSPSLNIQRYQFVIEFVRKSRPRKVMDLGCSDCKLLRKLRFHRHGIELLAGVDRDCSTVRETMHALAPLLTDYLQPSTSPLTIELYEGSVLEIEPCTKGFDLVTCIELIEHLQLWEVDKFSDVVFGFMEPQAVIISTPNVEFNPLLPGTTGFRHRDHKFEWTRGEFQTWALGVCRKYGYSVEFTGVGVASGSERDVGFCTQIGVFQRDASDLKTSNNIELEPTVYRLLYKVVYPSLCDNNILQRTLVSEVIYTAEKLRKEHVENLHRDYASGGNSSASHMEGLGDNEVYRRGRFIFVPLRRVWSCFPMQTLCGGIQQLRGMLLETSRVRLDANTDSLMLADDEEHDEEHDDEEEESNEDRNVNCAATPVCYLEEDWESELMT